MFETIRFFANTNSISPSSRQDQETGEVCIANISPRERQMRMRYAVAQFTVTLIILAVLMIFDIHPAWRLLLLFLFWAAGIGYFEARDKTCVAHTLNNTRKTGDFTEKVEDGAELQQIHRQSRRVMIKAFFVALAFTLIAYFLP